MTRVCKLITLPNEVTAFERGYLTKVNRVALWFLAAHLPVFAVIAWVQHSSIAIAVDLTLAVLAGPVLAHLVVGNPRVRSVVHGIAAMCMGGVLVHLGQGPVQIEMHFYFFALLAMCCVFANPLVIVAACLTVALHHLVVWLALPSSVFNYDASSWVVMLHAAFVVLESIAACFIARSFYDNVVALEKTVATRTAALDASNRDMRLLLHSIDQGFLTIDRRGVMAAERSSAFVRWFGEPKGSSWFDYLGAVSDELALASRSAWEEVTSGVLPLALALAQMPPRISLGTFTYSVQYRPIGEGETPERFLVVVTDITVELAREVAEQDRHDLRVLVEQALADRTGVLGLLNEGAAILETITGDVSLAHVKRLVHTLKGNSALYGLEGVALQCEKLEDWIVEHQLPPTPVVCRDLERRWTAMRETADRIIGGAGHVELDMRALEKLERAIDVGSLPSVLRDLAAALRLEPTQRRLDAFADQARRIAERLGKPDLEVVVESHDVSLDARQWSAFWGSFVHAVRNALDHGIELPDEREALHKPPHGRLVLRTRADREGFLVEVEDDGRGVDWDAVRVNAETAGLPFETAADLEAALFCDGLSTASEGAALSGRGVGMSALLEATRELGGTVRVRSTRNRGTTVAMVFPEIKWGGASAA